ncbi:hypothetical protein LOK74_02880 [Brevibacillus humidisoli]|uniref:hypothetical protein n=1 Tax=Brevibacillus humidisoli TaxID=2895522 RepID=UPI001E393689|nr:hypothetical protein [Brevibacillus humidisoli]UFJ41499.1 hypothetical protein LOK74_02880 [Brevibacillus humidisoli]
MSWTVVLAALMVIIYIMVPVLDLRAVRKAVGFSLFLQLFYLVGHYVGGWPFPTPRVIFQIFTVAGLGVALGVVFARIWPLSPRPGFERIIRTFLLVIPALGIGIGLQVLLQGQQATQAIYLMFALTAWLGSGHFVRQENNSQKGN